MGTVALWELKFDDDCTCDDEDKFADSEYFDNQFIDSECINDDQYIQTLQSHEASMPSRLYLPEYTPMLPVMVLGSA